MKSEILSMLRAADGYLSGQQLCDKMGVSRTAVWLSLIHILDFELSLKDGDDRSAQAAQAYGLSGTGKDILLSLIHI